MFIFSVLDRQNQQGFVDVYFVFLEELVFFYWIVVLEQDFVLVLVLLYLYLGSEMFVVFMGRCEVGIMYLFYIRVGVFRVMLLRIFLVMQNGRYMEYDCFYLVYVFVVVFRLELKDGKGVIIVDGELMVSEVVQGQVYLNYFWMVSGCMEFLFFLEL